MLVPGPSLQGPGLSGTSSPHTASEFEFAKGPRTTSSQCLSKEARLLCRGLPEHGLAGGERDARTHRGGQGRGRCWFGKNLRQSRPKGTSRLGNSRDSKSLHTAS